MSASAESGQMTLSGTPQPRPQANGTRPVAGERPIARVLVDISLPHLDRPFDYLVPADMADSAVPGARVRVRFAGTDHDGFILERADTSEHQGRLAMLRRVVSAEPVLTPHVARLARVVADRYAGTAADVVRLAVPPRHATTEREVSPAPAARPARPEPGTWHDAEGGPAFLDALAGAARDVLPRVVWNPGPGADWADPLARAVVTALAAGRGAVVVLPDARDVARLDAALRDLVGDAHHVVLGAEPGPAERYRRWLKVLRGSVRAAIGTRSAAFAPVRDLGLVAVWDDGDDLHAEPRAPYPHMREVLLLRAHMTGAAAVVGGFARTAEGQLLVDSGWARALEPSRDVVRDAAPRVHTAGGEAERVRDEAADSARIPSLAWRVARSGLEHGPVLVQVARAGYVPAVACARCRIPALCRSCGGGLRLDDGTGAPRCERCGQRDPGWRCPECAHTRLRAVAVGARRTAEELGRAFPGVPIVRSSAQGGDRSGDGGVRDEVDTLPCLVVATHGAEPVAADGYAAALLLDGTSLLGRPGLRAAEEALRRWLRAAALVRPGPRGGEVVVVADSSAPAVQALVRWDPAGFATRELAERAQLHFPPAARLAELHGGSEDVEELLSLVELPEIAETSGPRDVLGGTQVTIRVPRAWGTQLAGALRAAGGVRSARRSGETVRVRIDPVDLA